MGMFDSLYDAKGNEWQTKAFECLLNRWEIGDEIPDHLGSYQVMVFGGPFEGGWIDSFATILNRRLTQVPSDRDPRLPLLDYNGGWIDGEPSLPNVPLEEEN